MTGRLAVAFFGLPFGTAAGLVLPSVFAGMDIGEAALAILLYGAWGMITFILWPTWIGIVIATPFVFRRLVQRPWFFSSTIPQFVVRFGIGGGIAGIVVLSPLLVWSGNFLVAVTWGGAGCFGGCVTYVSVALLYRRCGG